MITVFLSMVHVLLAGLALAWKHFRKLPKIENQLPCDHYNDIDDNDKGKQGILEILVDSFVSVNQENKKRRSKQQAKEKLHCRTIFAVIVWQRLFDPIDDFLLFAFEIELLGCLGPIPGQF